MVTHRTFTNHQRLQVMTIKYSNHKKQFIPYYKGFYLRKGTFPMFNKWKYLQIAFYQHTLFITYGKEYQ